MNSNQEQQAEQESLVQPPSLPPSHLHFRQRFENWRPAAAEAEEFADERKVEEGGKRREISTAAEGSSSSASGGGGVGQTGRGSISDTSKSPSLSSSSLPAAAQKNKNRGKNSGKKTLAAKLLFHFTSSSSSALESASSPATNSKDTKSSYKEKETKKKNKNKLSAAAVTAAAVGLGQQQQKRRKTTTTSASFNAPSSSPKMADNNDTAEHDVTPPPLFPGGDIEKGTNSLHGKIQQQQQLGAFDGAGIAALQSAVYRLVDQFYFSTSSFSSFSSNKQQQPFSKLRSVLVANDQQPHHQGQDDDDNSNSSSSISSSSLREASLYLAVLLAQQLALKMTTATNSASSSSSLRNYISGSGGIRTSSASAAGGMRGAEQVTAAAATSSNVSLGIISLFDENIRQHEHLTCPKCGGVLHQAVTLQCGHSMCRKCCCGGNSPTNSSLSSSFSSAASIIVNCVKCGRSQMIQQQQQQPTDRADGQVQHQLHNPFLRTNVTVMGVVDKWWAGELEAVEWRQKGNRAFAQQQLATARNAYDKSILSAPRDFTSLSNRSNLLAREGKWVESLADADQVVHLRPDWPKGHYRRACALKGLGRHYEAVTALLQCVAVERSLLPDVRDQLANVLLSIVKSTVAKSRSRGTTAAKANQTATVTTAVMDDEEDESSSSSGFAAAAASVATDDDVIINGGGGGSSEGGDDSRGSWISTVSSADGSDYSGDDNRAGESTTINSLSISPLTVAVARQWPTSAVRKEDEEEKGREDEERRSSKKKHLLFLRLQQQQHQQQQVTKVVVEQITDRLLKDHLMLMERSPIASSSSSIEKSRHHFPSASATPAVIGLLENPLSKGVVSPLDFECTLCCRLFWQPVTTPCGHSFCRTCLDRCMDHNPACPLCKTSLQEYLAERRQNVTEFLDVAMATFLPTEYAERSRIYDEDMQQLASSSNIPIFICTMAYPTVRCPLHVFEPRYRLMIRRCMETGSRQFGMCAYDAEQPHGFAQYGTMLEVRDVEFFPDGRSVVDTVGGRRFRVLSRGVLDGYCTASVEWLVDEPIGFSSSIGSITTTSPSSQAATAAATVVVDLHDRVRRDALTWIQSEAPAALRQRILQHFGSMPPLEADWMTSSVASATAAAAAAAAAVAASTGGGGGGGSSNSYPNGPSWLWWLMAILPLDPKAQVAILSMTRLEKRLEAIHRCVTHVRQRSA